MHTIKKTYRSRGNEWTCECECGWKEKSYHQDEVLVRFAYHKKFPHRSN